MTLSDYAQAFRAAQKRDAQSPVNNRQHQITVINALKKDPHSDAHTLSKLAPLVGVPLKTLQQSGYIARYLPADWASRYPSLSFTHLLLSARGSAKFSQAPYNTPSYWLDRAQHEHWTRNQMIGAIQSQLETSRSATESIQEVAATLSPPVLEESAPSSAPAEAASPVISPEMASPPMNPRIARVIALAEKAESLQQALAQALAEFNAHWAPYYGAQFTLQEEPLPFVQDRSRD